MQGDLHHEVFQIVLFSSDFSEDRHAPPNKKMKQKEEDEEEDLNDANYDEV